MQLADLRDFQEVRLRVGQPTTIGGDEGPIQWGDWTTDTLYVVRRERDLPKRHRRGFVIWQAGALVSICPRNIICSEFAEHDWDPRLKGFYGEQHILEIEGLESNS